MPAPVSRTEIIAISCCWVRPNLDRITGSCRLQGIVKQIGDYLLDSHRVRGSQNFAVGTIVLKFDRVGLDWCVKRLNRVFNRFPQVDLLTLELDPSLGNSIYVKQVIDEPYLMIGLSLDDPNARCRWTSEKLPPFRM